MNNENHHSKINFINDIENVDEIPAIYNIYVDTDTNQYTVARYTKNNTTKFVKKYNTVYLHPLIDTYLLNHKDECYITHKYILDIIRSIFPNDNMNANKIIHIIKKTVDSISNHDFVKKQKHKNQIADNIPSQIKDILVKEINEHIDTNIGTNIDTNNDANNINTVNINNINNIKFKFYHIAVDKHQYTSDWIKIYNDTRDDIHNYNNNNKLDNNIFKFEEIHINTNTTFTNIKKIITYIAYQIYKNSSNNAINMNNCKYSATSSEDINKTVTITGGDPNIDFNIDFNIDIAMTDIEEMFNYFKSKLFNFDIKKLTNNNINIETLI